MCNGVGHTHDLTIMTQYIVQVAHYLWKLSQNRTDEDRAGVVQGLLAEGTPAAADMAALVLGRLMG